MPKEFLHGFYSNKCNNIDKIFINDCFENNCKLNNVPTDSIILHGDNIEKCFSKGQLDNSADRIIILKNDDESLDILICELSKGKRNPELIEKKIIHTGEHIVQVLKNKFKINKFKCCYVGQYESIYKGLMKKKTPTIRIPHLSGKNNIKIKQMPCGSQFSEIM